MGHGLKIAMRTHFTLVRDSQSVATLTIFLLVLKTDYIFDIQEVRLVLKANNNQATYLSLHLGLPLHFVFSGSTLCCQNMFLVRMVRNGKTHECSALPRPAWPLCRPRGMLG